MLFIYCNYKTQFTAKQYLEALLRQLLLCKSDRDDIILSLKEIKSHGWVPNLAKLQNIIQTQLSKFSHSYIILDALDEILDDNVREVLLNSIQGLSSNSHAHILITSRPHITDSHNYPVLEIQSDSSDIHIFLQKQLSNIPNIKDLKKRVQNIEEIIVEEVYEKSSDM